VSFGVDMTSAVKGGSIVNCRFVSSPLHPAEESEPVIATVDHADIRGLATTLQQNRGQVFT
jgi:hypothetical protein